jgi:hypothetical protein
MSELAAGTELEIGPQHPPQRGNTCATATVALYRAPARPGDCGQKPSALTHSLETVRSQAARFLPETDPHSSSGPMSSELAGGLIARSPKQRRNP